MEYLTKKLTMPMGHKLLNYEGGCKNVHGHNFTIELTFSANKLDVSGFIVDLNIIKKGIGESLKDLFDHAFLVNPYDEPMLRFLVDNNMKYFIMPKKEAKTLGDSVGAANPTIENLAEVIREMSIRFATVNDIKFEGVKIYESETGWVELKEER